MNPASRAEAPDRGSNRCCLQAHQVRVWAVRRWAEGGVSHLWVAAFAGREDDNHCDTVGKTPRNRNIKIDGLLSSGIGGDEPFQEPQYTET